MLDYLEAVTHEIAARWEYPPAWWSPPAAEPAPPPTATTSSSTGGGFRGASASDVCDAMTGKQCLRCAAEKAQEARQCEAVATARAAAAAGGNKKRGAPFGGGAGEHAGGAEGFGGFGGFGGGAEAPKKKRKQLGPKKKKGE